MIDDNYIRIFFDALAAAQLVPLATHATFFALKGFGSVGFSHALCGVAGGAAGQMLNWALGRLLLYLRDRGKFYIREDLYITARRQFHLFFLPVLLFSWYGLGGALVVVAGFLRIRWWLTLALVTIGYVGFFGYWTVQ